MSFFDLRNLAHQPGNFGKAFLFRSFGKFFVPFCPFVVFTAVSYTHLDVYKRQGHDLLDPRYPGYADDDHQILTNTYRYDKQTREFSELNVPLEQAMEENEHWLRIHEIANLILKYDYFAE